MEYKPLGLSRDACGATLLLKAHPAFEGKAGLPP